MQKGLRSSIAFACCESKKDRRFVSSEGNMCVITSQRSREGCQKTKEDEVEKGRGFYQDGLTGVLRDTGRTRHSGFPLLTDAGQQLLDLGNRPAGVQSLGTGLGAIHDGVASVD